MAICIKCNATITCSCQQVKNGNGEIIGCTKCSSPKNPGHVQAPKNDQSNPK